MAASMIEELREKFRKIKEFKSKAKEKLTAEKLRAFAGFENMSLERREKLAEVMNEYARIVLMHLNNITKQRHGNLNESLSVLRLPAEDSTQR